MTTALPTNAAAGILFFSLFLFFHNCEHNFTGKGESTMEGTSRVGCFIENFILATAGNMNRCWISLLHLNNALGTAASSGRLCINDTAACR